MDFQKWVLQFRDKIRVPKACVYCQTIIFLKVPLCPWCRRYLYRQFLKYKDHVYKLEDIEEAPLIFCLWLWTDENDLMIRKIIVAMKDGANPRLYHLFANWMQLKLQWHGVKLDHDFCSVPSSTRQHPQRLRQVFQGRFKGENLDLLLKKEKKEQKTLTRTKRQKIVFSLKSFHLASRPLVLLDDVLVSGFSAKACVEVLETSQIEYILVWAKKPLKKATFLDLNCSI